MFRNKDLLIFNFFQFFLRCQTYLRFLYHLCSSWVILFRDFPVLTASNKIVFILQDLAIFWWVLLTEQQNHWRSWEVNGWSLPLIALSFLAAKLISLLVFLLYDRNNTYFGLMSSIGFDEIKHCKSFITVHLLPVSTWFRHATKKLLCAIAGMGRDGETLEHTKIRFGFGGAGLTSVQDHESLWLLPSL